MSAEKKPYLLIMHGDVAPELKGPYDSEEERDQAAAIWRDRNGDDDGIYRLDAEGKVEVDSYGSGEMDRLVAKHCKGGD